MAGATVPALPAGFSHDPAFDAAGYYLTQTPVQVGNYRLNVIALGAPSDFSQWENGRREGLFGPIFLDFSDITSPKIINEMGAEAHQGSLRLLPASYHLYPGDVSFRATDPQLGEVIFSGAFDRAAYEAGRKDGSSGTTPVLMGSLQVGDERIRNISFTYWAGD